MTHDIAKIDNYSVYRRLGNNLLCSSYQRRVLILLTCNAFLYGMYYLLRRINMVLQENDLVGRKP